MFWKIAGNQIENKAEIQSVQSKQCSSYSELIEKYEAIWIFPTHIVLPHQHHCSQKHNKFMKTCTKQKRSRFKFKVLHCWNWNVFFCKYLVCSSFSTNTIFCMENCWFFKWVVGFFYAFWEDFLMIMDCIFSDEFWRLFVNWTAELKKRATFISSNISLVTKDIYPRFSLFCRQFSW